MREDMISTAPVLAANSLLNIREKILAFIFTAREHAQDGMTLSEFTELAVALMRVVMAAVDGLPESGAEKKQWVLDAVGMLFDEVAGLGIPVPLWPVWAIVKPTVRQLLLLAVSGAIESMLPLVRISLR
jgi:hypothetical protein